MSSQTEQLDKIIFTKKGVLSGVVCAEENKTKEEIEEFINIQYPCEAFNGWYLAKDEDMKDLTDQSDTNGAQCKEYKNRKHWGFIC